MLLKVQLCITGINYIFKIHSNRKQFNFKLQYFKVLKLLLFCQINAAFKSYFVLFHQIINQIRAQSGCTHICGGQIQIHPPMTQFQYLIDPVCKHHLTQGAKATCFSGHLPQHVYRSCTMSHLFRLRLHSHINTTPAHTHICRIQTQIIVFADDRGKGVRPNVYPKRNWPLLISSIPIQDSDTVTISHSQPV